MKGFERNNQYLSLCGLNCGLCPMFLGKYCPGCGGGDGNQGCKIARCSIEHNNVDYCFCCSEYPCQKYDNFDEYDSFISHLNQKVDLEKAKRIGIGAYNEEQKKKMQILDNLLTHFNDGRKKTLFCQAANLLSLEDLNEISLPLDDSPNITLKEKSTLVAEQIKELAKIKGINLKLRKKKTN